ncbi:MAG: hypothetical protein AAGC97_00325 [Planctomycetota bacterium]
MMDTAGNSLRFLTSIHPAFVLALAGALTIASTWFYRRESRWIAGPWNYLLPALRGLAVFLIVLLIAGPTWHTRRVVGEPGRVVFAVDTSGSMSETDSASSELSPISRPGDAPSRLKRAMGWLVGDAANGTEGWIDQLSTSHFVDVVEFNESASSVWSRRSSDESAADPLTIELKASPRASTDLRSPLSLMRRQSEETGTRDGRESVNPSESVATMVLMTDGRDTSDSVGGSITDTAAEMARRGWRVHAIGLGRMDEPDDIAVLNVVHPERVADDGRLAGHIDLKHYGFTGRRLQVVIRQDTREVWSDVIDIQRDGQQRVEFDFAVTDLIRTPSAAEARGLDRDSVAISLSAGVQLLDISNESAASETSMALTMGPRDNDQLDFRVAAASRDRHLLILDGSARWEVRYLRNLFQRDPSWRVNTVLFGPGTDQVQVRRGGQPGGLPNSDQDWASYDAVILGEVPPQQWTVGDANGLREFVRRGGGLVIVDGHYEHIAELSQGRPGSAGTSSARLSGIRDLVPVEYLDIKGSPLMNIGGSPAAILRRQASRPIVRSIEPTAAGQSHPVLRIGGASLGNDDDLIGFWKQLPAPRSTPRIRAAVDAEVWAESRTVDGQSFPWLVTRMFGSGRVFYLSTDQTWRWRYKVESRLHGRFWNQLMTAVMQPPYAVRDDFVAIGTDRIDYPVGGEAIIRARLIQMNAETVEQKSAAPSTASLPTVDAILLQDGRPVTTVPLVIEDPDRGTFQGRTPPLDAGKYDVRIRASGYDAAALRATTPIWVVEPPSAEMSRVAVDESMLRQIAGAGGGRYVDESSASDILAEILPASRGRITESDIPLYPSGWMFLVIMVLMCTEWSLRKRIGLA